VCRSLCRWWRWPSHPEVELSTGSYTATEAAPDAPAHFAKAATRVLQRVRRADLCNVELLSLPFRHITHDPEPTVTTAVAVVVLQPAVFAACADRDSGASFVGSGTVQSEDRSSSSRCPVLLRFLAEYDVVEAAVISNGGVVLRVVAHEAVVVLEITHRHFHGCRTLSSAGDRVGVGVTHSVARPSICATTIIPPVTTLLSRAWSLDDCC